MTWSVNNGVAFSGSRMPGYLDSDDLKPRGDIMRAFGKYLHMSLGLLASSVQEYLIQVCTAHTARGLESPGRGPEYKLMLRRLEQDAAESPDRAYVISSTMVRMMLFESNNGNDEDHAMTAIIMLFTGGRPVELLGNDHHSIDAERRADFRHVSWHTSRHLRCDPFDADMCYMLMGLQRKGDRLSVQLLPVFRTGEPSFCAALQLGVRWHALGCPAAGQVFGRSMISGRPMRQYHFRDYLHAFETRHGFPRLVPYGLRRATATYLNVSGISEPNQMDFMGHKHRDTKVHKRYVDPPPAPFAGFARLLCQSAYCGQSSQWMVEAPPTQARSLG